MLQESQNLPAVFPQTSKSVPRNEVRAEYQPDRPVMLCVKGINAQRS